ncbi:MAG: bifunctional phosphoribosylaminoimidazolecarboxamide formyltransferase/IMP cyclohydrolase [Firmicutes bacterium]|nr:bifunctional phosphoribosylaminoimidazolecarboxamide formyltransferase/IMP cyclohydrolase [Bacillota bacterium]
MKKRALISVSDKTGIVEFATGLINLGYEIISTGGTAKTLSDNGIKNLSVSDITKFPECLDGRVKTLNPFVHAGILAIRDNSNHMKQLADLNVNTIDIVCVNLYPFRQTIEKEGTTFFDAVENIDIGGPCMLRSAAKNFQDVIVACDPKDYQTILDNLKSGIVDLTFRKMLMQKTYQHTAFYDTLIANYLAKELELKSPDFLTLAFEKKQDLRYGENPHQNATYYETAIPNLKLSLSKAEQLNGKELSFNNINDAQGAIDALSEFACEDECVCVAVKHATPCGVALGKDSFEAYQKAHDADPISIFGGIIAFNKSVNKRCAEEMVKTFLEVIIAPNYDKDALDILKTKPNLRVLKLPEVEKEKQFLQDFKILHGSMLVQDRDTSDELMSAKKPLEKDKGTFIEELRKKARDLSNGGVSVLEDKTKIKTTPTDRLQLEFGVKVVKHLKSNAIAIVKDSTTIGINGGQTNRVAAAKNALEQAGKKAKGAYLASDGFFPFADIVALAKKYEIKAIIQPGGSIKDEDSIKACDEAGIAMVMTGVRHFKH